jgi:hypothetical protein
MAKASRSEPQMGTGSSIMGRTIRMTHPAPSQYFRLVAPSRISASGISVLFALFLAVCVVLASPADAASVLKCTLGDSPRWGSAWCDLSPPQDFPAGTALEITLATGGAKRVLVRLLPDGQSPDDPIGIIGGPIDVPSNNIVRVLIPTSQNSIKQISVHGGAAPWNMNLGSSNGNAKIVQISR